MVVAGDRQHAAMLVRAAHVGAVEAHRPMRSTPGPLPYHMPYTPSTRLPGKASISWRAVQHGRGEVLVDPRLEADVVRRHQLLLHPQLPVQPTQRRAAIAGHQCGGVQPGRAGPAARCSSSSRSRAWMPVSSTGRSRSVKRDVQGDGRGRETDIHGRSVPSGVLGYCIVGMAAAGKLAIVRPRVRGRFWQEPPMMARRHARIV